MVAEHIQRLKRDLRNFSGRVLEWPSSEQAAVRKLLMRPEKVFQSFCQDTLGSCYDSYVRWRALKSKAIAAV